MSGQNRFLEAIWEEKLKAQARREALVLRKLGWVTGLLAVGAVKFPVQFESSLVLFLVPAIALVFDLYIIGENFGIKRMGVYVGAQLPGEPDGIWERWLMSRRDPFSRLALPLSTTIVFIGSALLLYANSPSRVVLLYWAVSMAAAILLVHVLAARKLAKLDEMLRAPSEKTG